MYVNLLTYTPEPERVVAAAARCCYSHDDPTKLFDDLTPEITNNFIERLLSSGHQTPFEHVSFTFAIDGISRACLAQLTRHRVGVAFSVRSQRYVTMDNSIDNFIVPDKTTHFEELTIEDTYQLCLDRYKGLMSTGMNKEDARMILPNGAPTSLVMTMNARELFHFFNLRCCKRAQWEIRELAWEILAQVKNVAPAIFKHAGASCDQLGYCPEGKMSCGKKITLQELLGGAKS